MTDRDRLTPPPEQDYVLSTSGLSWHVRRSNGTGGYFSVSEGHRDRRAALSKALSLGAADRTDVWESVGTGVFWMVERFRPAHDQAI